MVDHRVGGADALDLPSLASRQNLNLTAYDTVDVRLQGIKVNYYNDPLTNNISYIVAQQSNTLNIK